MIKITNNKNKTNEDKKNLKIEIRNDKNKYEITK